MEELTLDLLGVILEGIKELYFEWTATEDDIDIKSLVIGYITAHENTTYATAKDAYDKYIEPMFDAWDQEFDTLVANENTEEEFGLGKSQPKYSYTDL